MTATTKLSAVKAVTTPSFDIVARPAIQRGTKPREPHPILLAVLETAESTHAVRFQVEPDEWSYWKGKLRQYGRTRGYRIHLTHPAADIIIAWAERKEGAV